MNQAIVPIIFGFLLYIIYVLLPLIPAIIIYRKFPDTKVGADGFLGKLKINTTGAFAAYLIVVVCGFFIIKNNQELISNLQVKGSAWKVSSTVKFVEQSPNGGLKRCINITDDSIKSGLNVQFAPTSSDSRYLENFNFIAYAEGEMPTIVFSYKGYESPKIDLSKDSYFDVLKNKEIPFQKDENSHTIRLGVIQLVKSEQEYNAESFRQPVQLPAFIPADGPPKKSS